MTVAMKEREDETVSSIAWLVLLESGQATTDDRRRFALWLAADPAHAAAYRETAGFWAGLDNLSTHDVRDLDRFLVDDSPVSPGESKKLWRKLPAIAAAMLLPSRDKSLAHHGLASTWRLSHSDRGTTNGHTGRRFNHAAQHRHGRVSVAIMFRTDS